MSALAALGYLLMAIDLAGKAGSEAEPTPAPRAQRRAAAPAAPQGARWGPARGMGGMGGLGLQMRSPVVEIAVIGGNVNSGWPAHPMGIEVPIGGFDKPATGRIHKGVPDLGKRLTLIKEQIRRGASDPRVRKLAQQVLARRCPQTPGGWCVREKDWKGEADALFRFVRGQMRYTKDSAFADVFVSPQRTLFDRPTPGHGSIGDCDDYAITLGALLASVGHDVVLRVGAVKVPGGRRNEPNHIWLLDRLPEGGAVTSRGGRLYPLDASLDVAPGWEAPKARLWRVWDYPVAA